MYRFLTWAVGVLALATVLGAIGYDMTAERMATAQAAEVRAVPDRTAPAVTAGRIERLTVLPLQPAGGDTRVVLAPRTALALAPVQEEMGTAVRLTGTRQATVADDSTDTDAAWIAVPPAVGAELTGHIARFTVWARADRQNPARRFALALSVDGKAGQWTRFEAGSGNYESYTVIVPVPAGGDPAKLRVLIDPDVDGEGGAVSLSHLIVDRLQSSSRFDTADASRALASRD
ncbi:hypothetical protein L2U69_15730 [Zavarzinia compransoris]|uniref:hypothetical protein n=1 Tax=Zavarzinia marina TaxID=2911065 RepID=UPI001F48351D|nr:hypothetical protein [Zavarzinia marina]MCF4167102.1 hypothetical protein [Zavarzinia marina]